MRNSSHKSTCVVLVMRRMVFIIIAVLEVKWFSTINLENSADILN